MRVTLNLLDLNMNTLRQRLHRHTTPRRLVAREVLLINRVHTGKVVHII